MNWKNKYILPAPEGVDDEGMPLPHVWKWKEMKPVIDCKWLLRGYIW